MKKANSFQHHYLEKILLTEDEHLKELRWLVADSMKKERLISENLLRPPMKPSAVILSKVASSDFLKWMNER